MNIRLEIDREWLKTHEQEFIKAGNEQDDIEEQYKDRILLIDVNIENNEYLVTNDNDKVQVSGGIEGGELYFYLEDKPTINELLNLATIISKYYNKAKAAIEALKG